MRRTGRKKARTCPLGRLGISYLLVALTAALGWLYSSLPDHILLEPGQTLALPRFSYIQPLGSGGARNVVSTRTVGSYQATLSIGGIFPIKRVQAARMINSKAAARGAVSELLITSYPAPGGAGQ